MTFVGPQMDGPKLDRPKLDLPKIDAPKIDAPKDRAPGQIGEAVKNKPSTFERLQKQFEKAGEDPQKLEQLKKKLGVDDQQFKDLMRAVRGEKPGEPPRAPQAGAPQEGGPQAGA